MRVPARGVEGGEGGERRAARRRDDECAKTRQKPRTAADDRTGGGPGPTAELLAEGPTAGDRRVARGGCHRRPVAIPGRPACPETPRRDGERPRLTDVSADPRGGYPTGAGECDPARRRVLVVVRVRHRVLGRRGQGARGDSCTRREACDDTDGVDVPGALDGALRVRVFVPCAGRAPRNRLRRRHVPTLAGSRRKPDVRMRRGAGGPSRRGQRARVCAQRAAFGYGVRRRHSCRLGFKRRVRAGGALLGTRRGGVRGGMERR